MHQLLIHLFRLSYRRLSIGASLLLVTSCIEPFEPKVADAPSTYLVVDGAINSQGITSIRLSRTMSLTQKGAVPVESKARIYIEPQGGGQYALQEGPVGTYTSASLSLKAEQAVRLHFTLASGREYVSDFTAAKATPAIDSVTWKPGNRGLQIAVNSHDETSKSRYYRWAFEETWELTSAYRSYLEYKSGKIVDRLENIYNCWGSENPSTIMLGTTVRLAQDVVSQQPLTLLPQNSTKLRYKYSILVKQYALTQEEYSYLEALRKNTESIGTLFDPLPTQLTGNVHCLTDPAETVIGFVGAQSMQQQRIFIERSQLPSEWRFITGNEGCQLDTIPRPRDPGPPPPQDILLIFSLGQIVPIGFDREHNYYFVSTPDCVDCRKRGTNVRPSFWQ